MSQTEIIRKKMEQQVKEAQARKERHELYKKGLLKPKRKKV